MKKFISFITSMFFGMLCLSLIAIFGIVAAYIPQSQPMEFYASNYSNLVYNIISGLQLYKAYSSPVFLFFVLCLTLNLLYCTLRRITRIVKLLKGELPLIPRDEILTVNSKDEADKFINEFKGKKTVDQNSISLNTNNLRPLGSWLTHVGLLIIIVGFSFGNIFGQVTFVQGVVGDTIPLPFGEGVMEIENYDIGYRSDYSIAYYQSDIKIVDAEGNEEGGSVLVNEPYRYRGSSIYQVGTGWSVEIEGNGKSMRLYPGDGVHDSSHNYSIYLEEFFPDYILFEDEPQTLTPFLYNPMALYTIYEGDNPIERGVRPVAESFMLGDDEMVFSEPKLYTRLQISKAPDNIPALIGGIVLMLGLTIAFFYSPTVIFAKREDECWKIFGENKGNPYEIEEKVKKFTEGL